MDEPTFVVHVIFGTVDIEQSWRSGANGDLIGVSRRVVRSSCGCVVEVSPWAETGVRMVTPPCEPKVPFWWRWLTPLRPIHSSATIPPSS